jgi:plastocyanin
MRRSLVVLAAVTVAASALAACGDDGDDSGGSADSEPDRGSGEAPVALDGEVTDKGTEDVTGGGEVALDADDFYFDATFLEATPGDTLAVAVANEGDATHTFTIDSLQIDEEIQPGSSAAVEVTVPESGALNFYCRFHRGRGMQGAVFTQEGQSPEGSDAPADTAPPGGIGY